MSAAVLQQLVVKCIALLKKFFFSRLPTRGFLLIHHVRESIHPWSIVCVIECRMGISACLLLT